MLLGTARFFSGLAGGGGRSSSRRITASRLLAAIGLVAATEPPSGQPRGGRPWRPVARGGRPQSVHVPRAERGRRWFSPRSFAARGAGSRGEAGVPTSVPATSTGRLRARESGSRTGWGRLPPALFERPASLPSRAGERSIVPASSGSRTACRRSRPPPLGGWRAGAKPYPAPWAGGPTARCSGTALESPGSTPRSGRAPGSGEGSTPSSFVRRHWAAERGVALVEERREASDLVVGGGPAPAPGARTGAAGAMDGGCRTRWTPERRPGAGVPGGSRQAMDRAMTSSRLLPARRRRAPASGREPRPADAFAVSMGALLDGALRSPRWIVPLGERAGAGPAAKCPQLPATAATQLERAREEDGSVASAWPPPRSRSSRSLSVAAAIARARGLASTRLTDQRSSAARTASITWSTPLRRKTSGPLMRATPSRSSEPVVAHRDPCSRECPDELTILERGRRRLALTAWDRAVCRAWRRSG